MYLALFGALLSGLFIYLQKKILMWNINIVVVVVVVVVVFKQTHVEI